MRVSGIRIWWAAGAFLSVPWLARCAAEGAPSGQNLPPDTGMVEQEILGHTLTMPEGFRVSVYAEGLGDVRFMAVGPDGDVYATRPAQGSLIQISDTNADGVADRVSSVAERLRLPHGIAFRGDTLYVAETHRVIRFDPPYPYGEPKTVVSGLPAGGGHFTRTILFKNDHMYVSIGSSCNLCNESSPRRAAVVRYNLDGSGELLFARGLRNAVGLALNPVTGEIWATNNDRDNLGDDLPPDRVNILREGGFYGWPQCYLPNTPNPEYESQSTVCSNAIGPAVELPAHTAPLGIAFYQGSMFPPEYSGDAFVAEHGSWNRSYPIGYQVVRIEVEDGRPVGGWRHFVFGWQEGRSRWGRPVDVLVLPDGSILISDDEGGRIYRMIYVG